MFISLTAQWYQYSFLASKRKRMSQNVMFPNVPEVFLLTLPQNNYKDNYKHYFLILQLFNCVKHLLFNSYKSFIF